MLTKQRTRTRKRLARNTMVVTFLVSSNMLASCRCGPTRKSEARSEHRSLPGGAAGGRGPRSPELPRRSGRCRPPRRRRRRRRRRHGRGRPRPQPPRGSGRRGGRRGSEGRRGGAQRKPAQRPRPRQASTLEGGGKGTLRPQWRRTRSGNPYTTIYFFII